MARDTLNNIDISAHMKKRVGWSVKVKKPGVVSSCGGGVTFVYETVREEIKSRCLRLETNRQDDTCAMD